MGVKILYVMATNGGIGGLEKHTLELCNGLALNHEIHLIADHSYAHKLHKNVTIHAVDFSRSRFNPFLNYELVQKIKHIQPHILHAQASKAASILAPWLKMFKCKKIVTVHGIKSNLKPFLTFDHIIAVSGKIKSKFPVTAPVTVIWNGIQKDASSLVSVDNTIIQAIAIGRLEKVKGFDLLIEAWQGIDADLMIVGEGSQRIALEEKIKALDLEHRIKLLGFRSDIPKLIQSADCMIISSLKEGGPITLAESLFHHTPVLATNVGMVRDFVDEVFICEPNSAIALHNLLLTQLKAKKEMLPLFEESFQKANQQLTLDKMLTHTELLYRGL